MQRVNCFCYLLFTLIFFLPHGHSQIMNIRKNKDSGVFLSTKYQRGSFLVYDCVDGHFVCTNKSGFVRCREDRKDGVRLNQSWLPCAPLKEFKSEESCSDDHRLKVVDTPMRLIEKICAHDISQRLQVSPD